MFEKRPVRAFTAMVVLTGHPSAFRFPSKGALRRVGLSSCQSRLISRILVSPIRPETRTDY